MALADSKTMKAMVEFREHTGSGGGFKIEPCLLLNEMLFTYCELLNVDYFECILITMTLLITICIICMGQCPVVERALDYKTGNLVCHSLAVFP